MISRIIKAVNKRLLPKHLYFGPEWKIIGVNDVCNLHFKMCDVFTNIMIKTDGTAIPSHRRCYNKTMGNLHQQTLPEIWNSDEYGKFRTEIVKNDGLFPACNRCCSAF